MLWHFVVRWYRTTAHAITLCWEIIIVSSSVTVSSSSSSISSSSSSSSSSSRSRSSNSNSSSSSSNIIMMYAMLTVGSPVGDPLGEHRAAFRRAMPMRCLHCSKVVLSPATGTYCSMYIVCGCM